MGRGLPVGPVVRRWPGRSLGLGQCDGEGDAAQEQGDDTGGFDAFGHRVLVTSGGCIRSGTWTAGAAWRTAPCGCWRPHAGCSPSPVPSCLVCLTDRQYPPGAPCRLKPPLAAVVYSKMPVSVLPTYGLMAGIVVRCRDGFRSSWAAGWRLYRVMRGSAALRCCLGAGWWSGRLGGWVGRSAGARITRRCRRAVRHGYRLR